MSYRDGKISDVSANQGCMAMVEGFCNELHSKNKRGNVDLGMEKAPAIPLRFGSTPKGFSAPYDALVRAKLASREKLPAGFRKYLEEKKYFEKLAKYVESDISSYNAKQELERTNLSNELSSIWNNAQQLATIDLVPGFNNFTEKNPAPIEAYYKKYEAGEKLEKDIYAAIWGEHPRWKLVEKDFAEVKAHYLEYLKSNEALKKNPALQARWIERIRSVKLVLPTEGGVSCATTMQNALYFGHKNVFTVCAGDFNTSPNVRSAITHELSHALDPGNEMHVGIESTALSQKLFDLTKDLCLNGPKGKCPQGWAEVSDPKNLARLTAEIPDWNPHVPAFYQCLQYNPPKLTPPPGYISTRCDETTRMINSDLADNSFMLRTIRKEAVNSDSRRERNPGYMNPCGSKPLQRHDFNIGGMQAFFYTASYVCDQSKSSDADKIRRAGKQAAELQNIIFQKIIPLGGKFSQSPIMQAGGFSEVTKERFADSIGNAVHARLLSKSSLSVSDRRKSFLASIATYCSPPSIELENPVEAQAQKEFSLEPHSEHLQRRLELLSQPIREALACKKDFQLKDCVL